MNKKRIKICLKVTEHQVDQFSLKLVGKPLEVVGFFDNRVEVRKEGDFYAFVHLVVQGWTDVLGLVALFN
jgi:hypothetical protein